MGVSFASATNLTPPFGALSMTVRHCVLTYTCVATDETSATFVFKVSHELYYILHEGVSQMFDQANNGVYS